MTTKAAEKIGTKIHLIAVHNAKHKLEALFAKVKFHFQKQERLLIYTGSTSVRDYVDKILWDLYPHEFIPHEIACDKSREYIRISADEHLLEHEKQIFNLSMTPLILPHAKLIYELEDRSSPQLHAQSKKKYEEYRTRGFKVIQSG